MEGYFIEKHIFYTPRTAEKFILIQLMMKNRKKMREAVTSTMEALIGGKPVILARANGRFAVYYPFDCTALKIEREMWHAPRGRVLQSAQPSGYPHQL